MPKCSLDKYIFSTEKSFSWDKLNEIALVIARRINYLYQGCDMQILDFDIKPQNILLDSAILSQSAMPGTFSYIAPEMICRSFGVISSNSEMRSRDRPTMSEVIETLEAGVDGLQMLSRPFFCNEGHIHVEDSYHFSSELTAVSKEELSAV
uniref:Putative receptor-like protein kinase n=1 Tax=Aegilops tauschii TaxID=37682 RepID=M8C2V3_AEGTA